MQSIISSRKDNEKKINNLKTTDTVQIVKSNSRNAFARKTPPALTLQNSDLQVINCFPEQQ